MATEQRILDISRMAAEDLSDYQYHFVVLDATTGKARLPDSATEVATGVLQNAPELGEAAAIRTHGITKLVANAALAVGDYVRPEYVAADDAGKAAAAAGEMQCVRGMVVEAASAENDLAAVLLVDPSPSRMVISAPLKALTADNTVVAAVLAVSRAMRVTKISVAAATGPVDADGACTCTVYNYDASADAADAISAAFDLEGLTANEAADLTLTATAADLVLAAGDFIYASLASDSAAINTNMADACITIEADLL